MSKREERGLGAVTTSLGAEGAAAYHHVPGGGGGSGNLTFIWHLRSTARIRTRVMIGCSSASCFMHQVGQCL